MLLRFCLISCASLIYLKLSASNYVNFIISSCCILELNITNNILFVYFLWICLPLPNTIFYIIIRQIEKRRNLTWPYYENPLKNQIITYLYVCKTMSLPNNKILKHKHSSICNIQIKVQFICILPNKTFYLEKVDQVEFFNPC